MEKAEQRSLSAKQVLFLFLFSFSLQKMRAIERYNTSSTVIVIATLLNLFFFPNTMCVCTHVYIRRCDVPQQKINANSQQRKSNTNKNRILRKKKQRKSPHKSSSLSIRLEKRKKRKANTIFFFLSLLLRFLVISRHRARASVFREGACTQLVHFR